MSPTVKKIKGRPQSLSCYAFASTIYGGKEYIVYSLQCIYNFLLWQQVSNLHVPIRCDGSLGLIALLWRYEKFWVDLSVSCGELVRWSAYYTMWENMKCEGRRWWLQDVVEDKYNQGSSTLFWAHMVTIVVYNELPNCSSWTILWPVTSRHLSYA